MQPLLRIPLYADFMDFAKRIVIPEILRSVQSYINLVQDRNSEPQTDHEWNFAVAVIKVQSEGGAPGEVSF